MNIDQGRADTKLTTQIRRTIFLAFPIEDLARGDRGLQMARYLNVSLYIKWQTRDPRPQTRDPRPETNLSKLNATMVRMEA